VSDTDLKYLKHVTSRQVTTKFQGTVWENTIFINPT